MADVWCLFYIYRFEKGKEKLGQFGVTSGSEWYSRYNCMPGYKAGTHRQNTTLALQTSHFRCLKEAINGQIEGTHRSLGETDSIINGKGAGISS
ncbi:TALE protein [Artemisia annua]|uniref:TALE protein n=1 Tax=Artemisia annua TaxID=35608 RepID=A0A2U1MMM7_ARTAN|nr:TALE protein [Artemisia annua]